MNTKEIKHIRDLVLTDMLNGNDKNINGSILRKLDEQLTIPAVVGRSEQLVCDCGKPYHERDLEHGLCHKCWEPTKEAN